MRQITAQTLGRLEGGEAVPFRLELETADGTATEFICETLLRILPGRRLVVLARSGERQVILKLFTGTQHQRYLERERRGLSWLLEAAVAAPSILDQVSGPGVVGLVIEFIAGAEPVRSDNQTAIEQLARMLGRMHEAGIWQTDLHLQNFLACEGNPYAVDGDGVRRRSAPLEAAAGLKNLASLAAQRTPAEDGGQAGLLTAYAEARGLAATDRAEFRRLVFEIRGARIQRYFDKTRRDCTEFAVSRNRGERRFAVRGVGERLLQELLEQPESLFEEGAVLKAGNSATVVRLQQPEPLVVKRYNIKTAGHRLRRSLQRIPRYRRAWSGGQVLHFMGIPTARPLALLERRSGPLRDVAFLVMEDLQGPDLRAEVADGGLTEGRCREVTDLFCRLKAAGVTHGDTKATNFLIADGVVHLIDLDAMRLDIRDFDRDLNRFLENWQPEARERFRASFRKAGLL